MKLLGAFVDVEAKLRASGAGEFLGTVEYGTGEAIDELIAVELVNAFQRLAFVRAGAGHHVELLRTLAAVELVGALAFDRVAVLERVLVAAEDDRAILDPFDLLAIVGDGDALPGTLELVFVACAAGEDHAH